MWNPEPVTKRKSRKLTLLGSITPALVVLICGCGSLERSVSFEPLSPQDMACARDLPRKYLVVHIDEGAGFKVPFTRCASHFVPAVPIIYLKIFGTSDTGYSLMRFTALVPLCWSAKGMQFDGEGMPDEEGTRTNVILLGGWDTRTDATHPTMWRVRLIEIPLLARFVGPCFGFGSGYGRLLWIPIADKWKAAPSPPVPPTTALPKQPEAAQPKRAEESSPTH